jgi:hypothetical protein
MREPNTRKSRVKKEQENLTPFVDVNGLDCEYKPMNLAAKEQVGLKTDENGQKNIYHVSTFIFFLSDGNENRNVKNGNEQTYMVSQKRTKLVGIIPEKIGNR